MIGKYHVRGLTKIFLALFIFLLDNRLFAGQPIAGQDSPQQFWLQTLKNGNVSAFRSIVQTFIMLQRKQDTAYDIRESFYGFFSDIIHNSNDNTVIFQELCTQLSAINSCTVFDMAVTWYSISDQEHHSPWIVSAAEGNCLEILKALLGACRAEIDGECDQELKKNKKELLACTIQTACLYAGSQQIAAFLIDNEDEMLNVTSEQWRNIARDPVHWRRLKSAYTLEVLEHFIGSSALCALGLQHQDSEVLRQLQGHLTLAFEGRQADLMVLCRNPHYWHQLRQTINWQKLLEALGRENFLYIAVLHGDSSCLNVVLWSYNIRLDVSAVDRYLGTVLLYVASQYQDTDLRNTLYGLLYNAGAFVENAISFCGDIAQKIATYPPMESNRILRLRNYPVFIGVQEDALCIFVDATQHEVIRQRLQDFVISLHMSQEPTAMGG